MPFVPPERLPPTSWTSSTMRPSSMRRVSPGATSLEVSIGDAHLMPVAGVLREVHVQREYLALAQEHRVFPEALDTDLGALEIRDNADGRGARLGMFPADRDARGGCPVCRASS